MLRYTLNPEEPPNSQLTSNILKVVPTEVETIVGSYPSDATVLRHGFDTKPWWWTSTVETSVFERLRVSPDRGEPWKRITRADLFAIGSDRAASGLDLLVGCYAWGMGSSVGNLRRYRRPLRDNPVADINGRIAAAREVMVEDGPVAAYLSLGSAGPNKLVGLGPSFYSKLLYASGGMSASTGWNALILDRFVVVALNDLARHGIDTEQRPRISHRELPGRARYMNAGCDSHTTKQGRACSDGRPVRPDAVEMAVFRHGRKLKLGS